MRKALNMPRLFWRTTVYSFLVIVVGRFVFPVLTPWSWDIERLLWCVPLLACVLVSIWAGSSVSFAARFIAGLMQSLALPVLFDVASGSISRLLLVSVWYAGTFALVTHVLGTDVLARAKRARWAGRCVKCHYDLTGNVSGICPECGTPVDDARLAKR